MKHLRTLCLLAVLSFAVGAFTQGGSKPATPAPAPAPQAQAAPQPAPTFATLLERQISASEKALVQAAEAMPEDKYNFTPESLNIQGSDYKGVRTFALEVKAEIVKFLKDSYALGHKAAATLTAENVLETVTFPMGKGPRLYLATNGVVHANDHYGQMVEYLRMNGIVPPASAGR
jgi:hypothetical protein